MKKSLNLLNRRPYILRPLLTPRIAAHCFSLTNTTTNFGTAEKIDAFAAAYGTVLFFEDVSVVKALQEQFPLYQHNFPVWSQQANGMLQSNVWVALSDVGLGASLQHYTELIEGKVREEWNIPADWKMTAQMPFGLPVARPAEKNFVPAADRVIVYQ
jgi:predicted oxidoreductase (fatty acid repression mutant protein)